MPARNVSATTTTLPGATDVTTRPRTESTIGHQRWALRVVQRGLLAAMPETVGGSLAGVAGVVRVRMPVMHLHCVMPVHGGAPPR
jgi:hypothetical protein